jgi:hypothetical protein
MRKSISLGLLVLANILAMMLFLFPATAGDYFWRGSAFDPGKSAFAGLAASQLIVLAIMTAFYDPRLPAARWSVIAAILFCSLTILALESAVVRSLVELWRGWIGSSILFRWRVQEHLFGTAGIASILLAASVALILIFHILTWPLRTTFGWRLVRIGDPESLENSRQFRITHLLAWVGFSAALMWLLTTAAAADNLAFAILGLLMLAGISLLFMVPWLYLLRRKNVRFWPLAASLTAFAALCYVAQEGISQFNFYQLTNSKSVAAALTLPSFQFLELFGFVGTITLTTFSNLFALRKMGFRFHAAAWRGTSRPPNNSSPSHSTTIAPQPSNVTP